MRTLMYRLVTLVSLLLVWANAQKVWVSMPPMIIPRSDHTATLVGDVIILTGGCVSNQICPPGPEEFCFCEAVTSTAEAYLPAVNDWIKLEEMPRERYRHAAAAVGLKLYVFGGRDLQDSIITEVDVFDYVTRQWATLTNPWAGATSDLSGVAIGTMLYALGGYTLTYDAVNATATFDTTETDAQWEYGSVAPMYLARGDSCASVIDNSIYLFGGFEYTNFCEALNILEVYNFDTNQWTIETPLHYPRGDSGCAVIGGKFHAIGGEQKDNVTGCSKYDIPIKDVEVFDLSSNSWAEETPLPEVRFRFAAASYQDTLFIFGGQGAQHNGTYPVLDTVLSIVDTTASTSQSTVVTMFMALTATCVMLLI